MPFGKPSNKPNCTRSEVPEFTLFQIAIKMRLIRWSFKLLASLLARYPDRSGRVCASLASRQPPKILRALVSA